MTSSRYPDDQEKKPEGKQDASVSHKRRRLIKGFAAAAPGIFTLHSGNAQAMLSARQCTAHSKDMFTGDVEFAGESRVVDDYVRLASGDGIYAVWTEEPDPEDLEKNINPGPLETREKWFIDCKDSSGSSHYIEAGYLKVDSSSFRGKPRRYERWFRKNSETGKTWNEVLTEQEWIAAPDSGLGVFGSPLKLIDPNSDPARPDIYVQDFNEAKTIQVLACVDDSGNVVSAYPRDCDALGLAPPSGSCWASIGSDSMDQWWG